MQEDTPKGPVSNVQIDELQSEIEQLNQGRPTYEKTLEHTPDGIVEQEVNTEIVEEQNADIDAGIDEKQAEQDRMEEFLNNRQGDAKRDFDQNR